MMPISEVGPPPRSIRKGLKQHPIRENHNHCQCCKLSKCSLPDKAGQNQRLYKGMSALPPKADMCSALGNVR